MLNIDINQDVKEIILLMGKDVSFCYNLKLDKEFFTQEIKGQVTDVVLSLSGEHQLCVEGNFFCLSDLIEFNILD